MILPRREHQAWLVAALWTLTIFIGISLARWLQALVEASIGREFFTVVVLAALAAGAALVFRQIVLRREAGRARSLVWLCALCAIYAVWTLQLRGNPEESLHLIEYGVLGILVYHALSFKVGDALIYLIAFLLCSIVGTLDEIIQWFAPDRIFDYRDIVLNAASALLMQFAIAKVFRPPLTGGKSGALSVRLACRAALFQTGLLALCLSNTPPAVIWLSSAVKQLAYLKTKDNLMTEYGFRHQDPEIGTFYSRFEIAQLQSIDRERAAETASILDHFQGRYEDFLRRYSPLSDPFLHELRVRIFRRDEHLAGALEKGGAATSTDDCTIAFRENLLLERYFGESLRGSAAHQLPAEELELLRSCADPRASYESPVSGSLIVRITMLEMWAAAVIFGAGCWWAQKRRGREE